MKDVFFLSLHRRHWCFKAGFSIGVWTGRTNGSEGFGIL